MTLRVTREAFASYRLGQRRGHFEGWIFPLAEPGEFQIIFETSSGRGFSKFRVHIGSSDFEELARAMVMVAPEAAKRAFEIASGE